MESMRGSSWRSRRILNIGLFTQNEDLTMRLASLAGLQVPFHGMIYAIDGSLLYFIQRFDRENVAQNLGALIKKGRGRKKTIHKTSVEDFAQLASLSRETKYDFSMEKLVPIIEKYCTFPLMEKKRLFRLTLFSFLVGNEDLHVKNFSLIRHADVTELSPAYDLVNSTILLKSKEELPLPLKGKKSNLTREDLTVYYAHERLSLPYPLIQEVLEEIEAHLSQWKETIQISFLSSDHKQAYIRLLESRCQRLYG